MLKYTTVVMMLAVLCGCAKSSDVFDDLNDSIASPNSMAIDVASNRLYLVNSNSKVLYDSTQGNFQVLDITNPLAPVLLKTAQTLSFSGQVYLDLTTKRAYLPNRYTASQSIVTDRLYNFNIDEASPDFLTKTETTLARDAYTFNCCYPANRAWITTSYQELQYVDLGSDLTPGNIPLTTTLDTGGQITEASVNHIVIMGNEGFLSREAGGIMIVNLDEAGVAGSVPVDYFISNIEVPRGLATDGTLLYVVGEGSVNDTWTPYLLIINPSAWTATTTNTNTKQVSKEDGGALLATIQVGLSPQEVLLTTAYAFVTNMQDNTVSVIDLATRTKIKDIPVGVEPFTLALYRTLAGVDQYVYVGNMSSDTISIIDIPTLAVAATY